MPRLLKAEPFPDWRGEPPAMLTFDDLGVVLGLLAEVAPRWSAELNSSGPGDSTIVVLPEGASDVIGPAFVLHREQGRVRLDQFRWDEYREIGGFETFGMALAALRSRLTRLTARPAPGLDNDDL